MTKLPKRSGLGSLSAVRILSDVRMDVRRRPFPLRVLNIGLSSQIALRLVPDNCFLPVKGRQTFEMVRLRRVSCSRWVSSRTGSE